MNIYTKYLRYILEHKKNVFNEAIKMSKETNTQRTKRDLIFYAFTHDLSKFNPKEFIPYAKWFYGEYGANFTEMLDIDAYDDLLHIECKKEFAKAWQHHKDKNKHHWNYWHERNLKMPYKYILQMIIDWKAMSVKFGDTAQAYYLKNYNNIKLNKDSRLCLESNLGLSFTRCCECDEGYWMTINELIQRNINYKKNNPNTYCDREIRMYIANIDHKYNVNTLNLLGYKEQDIYRFSRTLSDNRRFNMRKLEEKFCFKCEHFYEGFECGFIISADVVSDKIEDIKERRKEVCELDRHKKYIELLEYKTQLEEALYEYTDQEYSDFIDDISNNIQEAYDNKEITKEQTEKLCVELEMEIDYE